MKRIGERYYLNLLYIKDEKYNPIRVITDYNKSHKSEDLEQ